MFGKKTSLKASVRSFEAALKKKKLKYTVGKDGDMIYLSFNGDHYKSLRFSFIFDDDGESVALRVFSIEKFAPAQLPQAYEFCNRMSTEYRWLRFYVDSDNELTAGMDAVITSENAGDVCSELLSRAVDIVDDVCGALRG